MGNNIYFKITTIPATEDRESKEFELFFNKYREAKQLSNHEEAFKTFLEEGAKNPTFSRLLNITVGFVNKESNELRIVCYKGKEAHILQQFYNVYTSDLLKGCRSVMWNAEFVLPFLSTRSIKNGVKNDSAPDLLHYGLRPWNLKCLDLSAYIKGVGWFIPSLEETAFNFNLETDFVDPSDVYTLIKTGQENTVDESSIDEVKALINIHRIVSGEEPIFEVNSSVVELKEVEVKEISVLEKLYNTKSLNKEELLSYLKERGLNKKTPKKEKEELKKIILAHYLERIEIMDFDEIKKEKTAINEQRIKEIEELI